MSHPQPPQRQPTPADTQKYANTLRYTALATLVACPVLALLPPRKLDFYTVTLAGTTVFSANYLVRERTGRSLWQHVVPLRERQRVAGLEQRGENAGVVSSRLEGESLRRGEGLVGKGGEGVTEQVESQREAWKRQREREIREDVEEGKGLGDIMMEQIWEVWNWGKKGEDGDE